MAALGVLACSSRPGPGVRTSGTMLTGDSLVSAVHALGRSFGESRALIAARLGPPLRAQVEAVPNRHVAAVDTAIGLWYTDAFFELLRSGATGQEFLVGVELWDSGRRLPGGLRIGSTVRRSAETVLGAFSEIHSSGDTATLTYLWPPDGAEEDVMLRFVRDTLRAIGWAFYVD